MLSILAMVVTGALLGLPRAADRTDNQAGNQAGDFDYYVLSLSWNAAWCAAEGDRRNAPQCDPQTALGQNIGFTLHGLWPQHTRGWPEYCTSAERDPSRAQTAAMADIMSSGGLAWHQWKKHGRCSGLDSAAYFALAREAWEAVKRPEILRRIDNPIRLSPKVIEHAFIEANPRLTPDGVTVTCKDRTIREVRICLTKSLVPRPCTGETARDCAISDPLFQPMR
jgi:ribonuclease T2